jgi:hypothetical protein
MVFFPIKNLYKIFCNKTEPITSISNKQKTQWYKEEEAKEKITQGVGTKLLTWILGAWQCIGVLCFLRFDKTYMKDKCFTVFKKGASFKR